MSNLLFYSKVNMDCPEVRRVILIPIVKTPTLKIIYFGAEGLTLEIKLGPLFQGLVCPK